MDGIVVGVDRSAAATAALEWALAEGVRRGLEVTVVHAWTDVTTAGYPVAGTWVADPSELEQTALETAAEMLKEATERVPGADSIETSATAVRGAAAAVLAEASSTADLVVVGTRSASALSRAVLGSVSSSLLHHAHCPVVVVPAPAPRTSRPPRVVVGVDHSRPAKEALVWAAGLAARTGAVLVPVYVREPSLLMDRDELTVPELEAHERASLVGGVPAGLAVDVQPEVTCGHAGEELLRLVDPQDVLVVGSRGRGGFTGLLLGSTSTSVAQHAHCPVAVVRYAR